MVRYLPLVFLDLGFYGYCRCCCCEGRNTFHLEVAHLVCTEFGGAFGLNRIRLLDVLHGQLLAVKCGDYDD